MLMELEKNSFSFEESPRNIKAQYKSSESLDIKMKDSAYLSLIEQDTSAKNGHRASNSEPKDLVFNLGLEEIPNLETTDFDNLKVKSGS